MSVETTAVKFQWLVKIPLRDGTHLAATIYTPRDRPSRAPCIVALTPYTVDHLHDRGVYFAGRGLPFIAVDLRGRGNSEGVFRPWERDAQDGYDVVEWVARQPYCNGKVAMCGGSYLGYAQWATAKELPPHLATIVPTAAPYVGVDVPMRNNIFPSFQVRWLTVVSGRASQMKIFSDGAFWSAVQRQFYESGIPFRENDAACGNRSAIFQEWMDHPEQGAYWDSYNPTADDYARLQIPILTITGAYDGDQPGALEHYKQHMCYSPIPARSRHYLVIGPWDHAGTVLPQGEFGGLKVGPASIIDMYGLHAEWYAWIMQEGPKPGFLQNNIAYYVAGAEQWRYAAALEDITAHVDSFYLGSTTNPTDVFHSGSLTVDPPTNSQPDSYIYDPNDVGLAELESEMDWTTMWTDQRTILASVGKQLIYHSRPFEEDTEISGFFRLEAWISIDRPDTDFRARIYEIDIHGDSIQLSMDSIRARYRENPRNAELIRTQTPLRYEFNRFTFIARRIQKGNRIRLVLGPINSIQEQKNYNSGGAVSEESMKDARPVTVQLYHDAAHPSALYVPVGRAES